jgi:hypothetical protein
MDANDFQVVTKKWQPSFFQRLRWGDDRAWWQLGTALVWVIVLLMLWLTPACSHIVQARAVTGMAGRQCEAPRRVMCGKDLRISDCLIIEDEVSFINTQLGFAVLNYGGWLPCAFGDKCLAETIEHGVLPVLPLPTPARLDHFATTPQRLAETRMLIDEGNGCIGPAFIVIIIDERDQSYAERRLTFRHELLHALGVPHSNWAKSDTVMAPAAGESNTVPVTLAPADLTALRAIYQ